MTSLYEKRKKSSFRSRALWLWKTRASRWYSNGWDIRSGQSNKVEDIMVWPAHGGHVNIEFRPWSQIERVEVTGRRAKSVIFSYGNSFPSLTGICALFLASFPATPQNHTQTQDIVFHKVLDRVGIFIFYWTIRRVFLSKRSAYGEPIDVQLERRG